MIFFFVPDSPDQEAEDLRTVLRLPAGRRMFRRLLNAANLMDQAPTSPLFGSWLATKIEIAASGEISRLMAESSNDKAMETAKPRRKKNVD